MLVLLTGGARSGKSSWAERIARKREEEVGSQVCYLATARAGDSEMEERITIHQDRRPDNWQTVEEPLHLAAAIKDAALKPASTIILDCVTLLVTNWLLDWQDNDNPEKKEKLALNEIKTEIIEELETLLEIAADNDYLIIAVSNEVGQGVVPPNSLGRLFRDLNGWINQWLAEKAQQKYLVVAGNMIDIDKISTSKINLP